MFRALLLTASLVFAVVAPAGAYSKVLSRHGRVGPFQVDRSTTSQVRAVQGRPNRIRRSLGENARPVLEWRYDCGGGRSATYFFNARGVLGNFITTCRSWATADGTSVGMSSEEAELREGKPPSQVGCGDGLTIRRVGRAEMFISFSDDGSPVRALAVAGHRSVLGC